MFRGTTPNLVVRLKDEQKANEIDVLQVTLWQPDGHKLIKVLSDFEIEGNLLYCTLTQTETLAFDADKEGYIQARMKFGSKVVASKKRKFKVEDIETGGEI